MAERILIHPVTRIEGHAKISIYVDDAGAVESAQFHVVEFRGFEKICQGRPFHEMPGLMSRICGICPVSHILTSAKACDALAGRRDPHGCLAPTRVGQLCADPPIARAQLLPPLLARSAARFRRSAGQAQYLRPARSGPGFCAARHPAEEVRPAHHRVDGRQAHPSFVGDPGRGPAHGGRPGARRNRHRRSRSAGLDQAGPRPPQVDAGQFSR